MTMGQSHKSMLAHIKASLSDVQTLFLMTEAQIPEEKNR